jgi:hypothetical protein
LKKTLNCIYDIARRKLSLFDHCFVNKVSKLFNKKLVLTLESYCYGKEKSRRKEIGGSPLPRTQEGQGKVENIFLAFRNS